ncbi:lysophospholipid acyltransferase family protein [Mesoterricola sediminis]|uniref:1-acyl-sn-glycerol-3-phosphate acyltransferase n=1 Tax=Mesoterricola sediminis TaxID=2927980 RepID=A0AA48KGJ8_9BACT|nr:lysophospholipid acyltransferase family protein [Mesoterricola sediminis]BDU77498.1 1-acyl-sn-glycerol-3-phosphate acyltransferase [Mesoterricola sediminis]
MRGWKSSWPWRVVVTAWGLVTLPLAAVAIILGAAFLGPKRSFWTFAPLWSRSVFGFFGMHNVVLGWEALPEEIREQRQPVVFMANHESILDPPVLMGALPIPAVYISKKELKWMVPVGWAAAMGGTIFIDRSNREKAVASIAEAARQIRGGKSVVIFPEGTRTRTGDLLPFKKGGFALAQDAGTPIVPLGIGGAYTMLPPGSLLVRPCTYVIAVGAPVDPAAYDNREELMAEVRARIANLREQAHERL